MKMRLRMQTRMQIAAQVERQNADLPSLKIVIEHEPRSFVVVDVVVAVA